MNSIVTRAVLALFLFTGCSQSLPQAPPREGNPTASQTPHEEPTGDLSRKAPTAPAANSDPDDALLDVPLDFTPDRPNPDQPVNAASAPKPSESLTSTEAPPASHEPAANTAAELAHLNALVTSGDTNAVSLYLEKDPGAVSQADAFGRWPMHYARTRAMVERLWERAQYFRWPFSVPDQNQQTPLHVMAEAGADEAVKVVVERVCRQSKRLQGLITGLPYWAGDRFLGNVLNQRDKRDRTALHLVALHGGLLAADAVISCTSTELAVIDNRLRTALHYAASRRDFAVGYAILVQGTRGLGEHPISTIDHLDIDARDANGDTALHIAERCRNVDASRVLRRFGARTDILNFHDEAATDAGSLARPCTFNETN